MKYLKTFEKIDQSLYKKYMLYKTNTDVYFVLEIDKFFNTGDYWGDDEEGENINQEFIATKKLYIYRKNLDKLKRGKHQYFNFQPKRDDDNIIHQSDNLQDVLDMIPVLKNLDKYNL